MAIVGSSGGGASPFLGFKPNDIAGLVMHFDARVFSSFTLTPVTDKIQQWDDLSGNGHHAVQALTSKQPKYLPGGFNARPAAVGDGGHFLNTNFILPDSYAGTVFCVWRTAPSYASGQDGPYGVLRSDERFYIYTNTVPEVVWGCGDGASQSSAPPVSSLLYTTQIIGAGKQNCWQNGVQKVTDDSHTFTTPISKFYLFAVNVNLSAARHLDGSIAEFIMYDNVLSDGDRLMIENNLRIKWGDLEAA